MLRIVPLDRNNVPYAVGLCEELHGLGSYRDIAFDRAHTFAHVTHVASTYGWFCQLCHDDKGIYTGIVAGRVEAFAFSPQLIAVEACWYVRAGSQDRTKNAVQLMRNFTDWALNKMHAVVVQTGDVANIDSVAVDALYRHLGFKRVGTMYQITRDV